MKTPEQEAIEDSGLKIALSIGGKKITSVPYEMEDNELVIIHDTIKNNSIIDLTFSGNPRKMAKFIRSLDENYDMVCEIDSKYFDISALLILIEAKT